MPSSQERPLIVKEDPKAVGSEAFRTLRTNLQFASLDKSPDIILLTSAGPSEGKSTISANLALSIVQSDEEVVLVDCDLRKPVMHKVFSLDNSKGLTSVLTDQVKVEDALQEIDVKGLQILTSGPLPPNPAEILGSDSMKELTKTLRATGKRIIFDAPPVLPVADAMILSSYVDGIIFVISAAQTLKDMALRAKKHLETTNANILGVVLNNVDFARNGEHYYYNYYSDN